MKIVPRAKLNVFTENGNLTSGSKLENKRESGNGSEKQGIRITKKTQTVSNLKQRCVLTDRTNSNWTDNKKPVVYSSTIRSCGLKETVTLESSSYLRSVPSNTVKKLFSKPPHSNESLKNSSMKKTEDKGAEKLCDEVDLRKNTVDVYEFLIEDDDVGSENKCKTREANKCKTQKSKKCRKKRKFQSIEDSPDEVMPAKKVRKPLQERTPENSVSKTNSKFETRAVQLPSVRTPFSNFRTESKARAKTVRFNIPSCERLEPTPYSEINTTSTPKSKFLRLAQNEKNVTPTESVNQTPLPQSGNTQFSCTAARHNKPVCAKEVSKQLLSFFSPLRKNNSDRNAGVASRIKTPTKPIGTHSLQAGLQNTKTDMVSSFCETVKPHSPPQVPHHSDKQECLTAANYFGFEEDESEDEFSPVKPHIRSSHQTGKFLCSTPKAVNINEKSSLPFRFPTISAIKLQRQLQHTRNTPASATKDLIKNGGHVNAFVRKEPHAVKDSHAIKEKSVKKSSEPAIFDIEEEGDQFNEDDNLYGEFLPSVTVKDREVVSSPIKRVQPQRNYATPKPGVSREFEHDEAEENVSEDEDWETSAKKYKRLHRPQKKNEVNEWAKSFNSMCENIESFELIVE